MLKSKTIFKHYWCNEYNSLKTLATHTSYTLQNYQTMLPSKKMYMYHVMESIICNAFHVSWIEKKMISSQAKMKCQFSLNSHLVLT